MGELEPLGAFAVAAVVTALATPLATRLATRTGALAAPSDRGLHERPTPYLGGVAMLAGALAAVAVFLPGDGEVRSVMVGAVVIVAVGVVDDAFDLHPAVKLLGQLGAALIPVLSGVVVTDLTLPLVGFVDLGAAAVPLTAVGIVALMNVVNFSDGIDGLAAGVCGIAALTFAVIALDLGRPNAATVAALTLGICVGFLPYNFNPARIFMGDSGSNLLGLLLGCAAVLGLLKTTAIFALALPLVLLAVPILDTGFVVARRIKNRLPFYRADAGHFHHRLAGFGMSPRRTVFVLYGWSATLAAFSLALGLLDVREDGVLRPGPLALLVVIGVVALAATLYVVYLLELFELDRLKRLQLRRRGDQVTDERVRADVDRELETGELPAREPG